MTWAYEWGVIREALEHAPTVVLPGVRPTSYLAHGF